MGKAYIYKRGKKISIIYMIIVIFIGIFFTVKLFQGFYNEEYLKTNVYKLKVDNFVKIFFSLNPSLEFISNSNDTDYSTIFNRYNFPILAYAINNHQETNNSVFEIYPFLLEEEDYENEVDRFIQDEIFTLEDSIVSSNPVTSVDMTYEQMNNINFLLNNLYTIDSTIAVGLEDLDINTFLNKDVTINLDGEGPKILVYHTHSQESFIDSRIGVKEDTVVGLGDELTKILEEKYNIEVFHLREEYDIIDGKLDRSKAYELIENDLNKIISENPSIKILIDLHRDGIPDDLKLVQSINGKDTAKIMFFNGLSKISQNGEMVDIQSLPNPYVKDNMAFSFKMQLKANELYPGFARKIYLKGYRYNLHLMKNSLLVEVGAQTNTIQEAKNAMEPLAEILCDVIN